MMMMMMTGPTPSSSPAHGATSLGWVGGNWKMEEDSGGGVGPRPPHLAAAAGLLQPCACKRAAAGCGGGGGGGGPCRGGWEGWQEGREQKVAS